MTKEYKTITEISGPLIFVEKTEPVGYMELVEIRTGGELKRGQVLDSSDEIVVIQVFEGTGGLSKDSAVSFTGDVIKMPLSPGIVGRVLSGSGKPRDGGPEIVPEVLRDIAGAAINPASR
jgi:V/A-type H+/Na+-transporting ATPase subunit B